MCCVSSFEACEAVDQDLAASQSTAVPTPPTAISRTLLPHTAHQNTAPLTHPHAQSPVSQPTLLAAPVYANRVTRVPPPAPSSAAKKKKCCHGAHRREPLRRDQSRRRNVVVCLVNARVLDGLGRDRPAALACIWRSCAATLEVRRLCSSVRSSSGSVLSTGCHLRILGPGARGGTEDFVHSRSRARPTAVPGGGRREVFIYGHARSKESRPRRRCRCRRRRVRPPVLCVRRRQ